MATEKMHRRSKIIVIRIPTVKRIYPFKDRHQATNMTLPTFNESHLAQTHNHQTLNTNTVLHQQNMSLAQISILNNTLSRRSSVLATTIVGGPSTGVAGGGSLSPNPNHLLTNPRRLASMAVIS